uniref:Uncharacterized protein n=1 Tax=Anguilla anguilla TaxID=7936 RepID=A0A0E9XJ43_ANGAN
MCAHTHSHTLPTHTLTHSLSVTHTHSLRKNTHKYIKFMYVYTQPSLTNA